MPDEPYDAAPSGRHRGAVPGDRPVRPYRHPAASAARRADGGDAALSLAPGWKAGGWDSWSVTDLQRQYCDCGRELRLMLTIDSSEWGGAGWWPREDPSPTDPDLPPVPSAGEPTQIAVGRYGAYRVFVCPADASHPHGADVQ